MLYGTASLSCSTPVFQPWTILLLPLYSSADGPQSWSVAPSAILVMGFLSTQNSLPQNCWCLPFVTYDSLQFWAPCFIPQLEWHASTLLCANSEPTPSPAVYLIAAALLRYPCSCIALPVHLSLYTQSTSCYSSSSCSLGLLAFRFPTVNVSLKEKRVQFSFSCPSHPSFLTIKSYT